MNARTYIRLLKTHFSAHANPAEAYPMMRYMRDQFLYLGIKSPLRKELMKQFRAEHGLPAYTDLNEVTRKLWMLPEREYQYIAIGLVSAHKKQWSEDLLELFEWMILEKSWWDTVDAISSDLVGVYFTKYPSGIVATTERWMNSGNIWLQRTAIIFQRKYKAKTDTKLLFKYIRRLANEKEFFIRKGIGWALREYSYYNPEAVKDFVRSTKLQPLSVREGLRAIRP